MKFTGSSQDYATIALDLYAKNYFVNFWVKFTDTGGATTQELVSFENEASAALMTLSYENTGSDSQIILSQPTSITDNYVIDIDNWV